MYGRELEELQSSAHFTLSVLFFTANFKRNVETSGLKTPIFGLIKKTFRFKQLKGTTDYASNVPSGSRLATWFFKRLILAGIARASRSL